MKNNHTITLEKFAKNNPSNFLDLSVTRNDRITLSHKHAIKLEEVISLVSYYDILRIEGIAPSLANILVSIGIRGVEDMRLSKADTLYKSVKNTASKEDYMTQEYFKSLIRESLNTPLKILEMKNEKIEATYTQSKKQFVELNIKKGPSLKSTLFKLSFLVVISLVLSRFNLYFLLLIPIYLLYLLYSDNAFSRIVSTAGRRRVDSFLLGHQYLNRRVTKYSTQMRKTIIGALYILFVAIFSIGIFRTGVIPVYASFQGYDLENPSATFKYFSNSLLKNINNKEVSRGELVDILIQNSFAGELQSKRTECFNDIEDSLFIKEICYAKSQGYISGDAYDNFNPDELVSHAEGLKFILKFNGYKVPPRVMHVSYKDLDKSQWYTSYAEFAKRKGIISKSKVTFEPEKILTVSDIEAYLARINK